MPLARAQCRDNFRRTLLTTPTQADKRCRDIHLPSSPLSRTLAHHGGTLLRLPGHLHGGISRTSRAPGRFPPPPAPARRRALLLRSSRTAGGGGGGVASAAEIRGVGGFHDRGVFWSRYDDPTRQSHPSHHHHRLPRFRQGQDPKPCLRCERAFH